MVLWPIATPKRTVKRWRSWSTRSWIDRMPGGYWDYPPPVAYRDHGDTSITQYALLGLWEAERAGIHIPTSVWDRAASWLCGHQDSDGGFWYHPGNPKYPPTNSMVAAGVANVLVCRLMLHGDANFTTRQTRKQVAIWRFDEARPQSARRNPHTPPCRRRSGEHGARPWIMPQGAVSRGWMRIGTVPGPTYYRCYFYYALERACTLAHVEPIGEHDWYDEISDAAVEGPSQGWELGRSRRMRETCPIRPSSCCFFRVPRPDSWRTIERKVFGGGLMIGGRGLADQSQRDPDECGRDPGPQARRARRPVVKRAGKSQERQRRSGPAGDRRAAWNWATAKH